MNYNALMTNGNDSKTKNSSRNIIFGVLLKLYQLLMPFIIRTIIIYTLGLEYAGLNSIFTSILSVLNIAELGVGTIMVFYMYKPIEEHDSIRICALMNLYKIYYRVIGFIILVIGLALTPFISKLIAGDIPADIDIYFLYYLNLGATVLSYWLFAYKNSLFQAHQRNDIISKITLITDTVKYFMQISLLYIFHNYYYYVIVVLLIQVINNILVAIMSNKFFPDYKAKGYLSTNERKKINASIRDVFYGQLGMTVTLSVDSIVISAFLGLVPLARYQNYYFVVNALIGFFTIFYQSLRASIGTNIIIKSKKDNYYDFKFISYIVMIALTFCSCCLMNLFQPFISLWVGEVNKLSNLFVLLMVLYFYIYEFTLLIGCYKDISGKWHADRFRPLITAICNLTLNIIMVKFIGLYGILLSTIISFVLINIPWLYHRVFIDVFDDNFKNNYTLYLFKNVVLCIICMFCCTFICRYINYTNLILCIIIRLIAIILINVLFQFLLNRDNNEFKRAYFIIKKKLI